MSGPLITGLALLSLAGWAYLLFGRGGFWRADQRLPQHRPLPGRTPRVVAVIPARNEAETIGHAVQSLLHQRYSGGVPVVVVDDHSTDGTAAAARKAAAAGDDIAVIDAPPLAPGWTGKLWALEHGVAWASRRWPDLRYLLLTDADIVHDPDELERLVAAAEAGNDGLVSLMVRLNCGTLRERLLMPAFVFFFQKLYPFAWVNSRHRPTAAAAGGVMLVRASTLSESGGLAPIRGRLIDDCALAAQLKRHGPIWLGLTARTQSLRRYRSLGEIWAMVARTADTQLDHSLPALAGTVAGMLLLYIVPVAAVIYGIVCSAPLALVAGGAAWAAMAAMMHPTLALYRLPRRWGALLPAGALLFTLMTLDSARRYRFGSGAVWKDRDYPRIAGRSQPMTATPNPSAAIAGNGAAGKLADADWAAVETVVRGSGTSFYWAIRLLPPAKRRAMFAIYAFCREVDDIADEPAAIASKLARLQVWRDEIGRVYHGTPRQPLSRALVAPARDFGLCEQDFYAVIDGMETDAAPRVRLADDAALYRYCDRVACAVGRLSASVFGADRDTGDRLAAALGTALQLTNILRDVGEDAGRDRLYLPEARLRAEGIETTGDADAVLRHPGAARVCRDLSAAARHHFGEAKRILDGCDSRQMRPARMMMEVYRRILDRLDARGWPGHGGRVAISKPAKLWIALRHGFL